MEEKSPSPSTSCATVLLGGEAAAWRIADLLAESFDADEVVVAAFEAAPGRWDLSLHFAFPPDEKRVREAVRHAAGDETARALAFSTVAARDWIRASLEGLAPVRAGRFVVHGRHDRGRIAANAIGIEIEAALAFGTGHHGTTRGCLILLDALLRRRRPRRVLDLGAGTGVLAIAAAKLLRSRVLATDIDPRAAVVAAENARLNGVGSLVESVHATGFVSPRIRANAPFDLVLANILAPPLRRLAGPMARHLAPGADIILSGLLPSQADAVIDAYRVHGISLRRRLDLDGWTSLLLGRPGKSSARGDRAARHSSCARD